MNTFSKLSPEAKEQIAIQITIMDFLGKYPTESNKVISLLKDGFFDIAIKNNINLLNEQK